MPSASGSVQRNSGTHRRRAGRPGAPRSETAVLAGGCFWGVQGVFQHVKGVTSAQSGYAGGDPATANYDTVSTETTGTPSRCASPMTRLRSPTDSCCGSSSASCRIRPNSIPGSRRRTFVPFGDLRPGRHPTEHRERLHRSAEPGRRFLRADRHDRVAGAQFFPAEAYHQDYLSLHPNNPYIVAERPAQAGRTQVGLSGAVPRLAELSAPSDSLPR